MRRDQGPTIGRGSARQALADAVLEIVTGAGTLEQIGQRMRPARARQRISEWRRGTHLPQEGDLENLVRACAESRGADESWSESQLRRFRALLAQARNEHTLQHKSPLGTPDRVAAGRHRPVDSAATDGEAEQAKEARNSADTVHLIFRVTNEHRRVEIEAELRASLVKEIISREAGPLVPELMEALLRAALNSLG